MTPDSALVYNTVSAAKAFRNKFRQGQLIARVGKKYVIVTQEQQNKLDLTLVDETPRVANFKSLDKWRNVAKAAGCRVRLLTRWAAGGGHYTATHPQRGIVGFYNHGTSNGRKLNSGHLHI